MPCLPERKHSTSRSGSAQRTSRPVTRSVVFLVYCGSFSSTDSLVEESLRIVHTVHTDYCVLLPAARSPSILELAKQSSVSVLDVLQVGEILPVTVVALDASGKVERRIHIAADDSANSLLRKVCLWLA
jgi:hypothetical protein